MPDLSIIYSDTFLYYLKDTLTRFLILLLSLLASFTRYTQPES